MGEVIPLNPQERKERRRLRFREGMPLEVPESFDPRATSITLHSSVEDAVYFFSFPAEEHIDPTQRNVARALLRRTPVEIALLGQRPADIVTIIYAGRETETNTPLTVSETYRYTTARGWRLLNGATVFHVKTGPPIRGI